MRVPAILMAAALSLAAQHQKDGEKPRHPFIGDAKAIAAGKAIFILYLLIGVIAPLAMLKAYSHHLNKSKDTDNLKGREYDGF